jgi:hypothetical protein
MGILGESGLYVHKKPIIPADRIMAPPGAAPRGRAMQSFTPTHPRWPGRLCQRWSSHSERYQGEEVCYSGAAQPLGRLVLHDVRRPERRAVGLGYHPAGGGGLLHGGFSGSPEGPYIPTFPSGMSLSQERGGALWVLESHTFLLFVSS